MRPLLLLCSLAFAVSAGAQTIPGVNVGTGAAQKAAPSPDTAPAPDLNARLAAAKSELDRVVAESGSKLPPGTPSDEVIERRALLELIVRHLERQLDARAELAIAQRDRAALSARAKAWPGLGPGPHPLSLADGLREAAQTAAERVKAAEARSALLQGEIEVFQQRLKDAEAKARLADERAGEATAPAEAARRAWTRDLAALRVRALGVVLAGLDGRVAVAREELAEHREALEFAQLQVQEASKSITFTRADYDRVLASWTRSRRQSRRSSRTRKRRLRRGVTRSPRRRPSSPPRGMRRRRRANPPRRPRDDASSSSTRSPSRASGPRTRTSRTTWCARWSTPPPPIARSGNTASSS